MQSALAAAAGLSDEELLARVAFLADRERRASVELVAHLAELDRRKLYRPLGFGSLFKYCIGVLHLSEPAAYRRIVAARCVRRFPAVLDGLGRGELTLASLCVVAPHLTEDNCERVLSDLLGKTKREAEVLVARIVPQEDVRPSLRKLPERSPGPAPPASAPCPAPAPQPLLPVTPAPSSHRPIVAPLAPERYRIQFTIGRETQETLRKAQDLLRREIPDGDLAALFDRALRLLVQDVARRKVSETANPRPAGKARGDSRHVPAAVKRQVWLRDGGRCAFVSSTGRRCEERSFLEFHHVAAFALGGGATVINISLRCREHNVYEAELIFGSREPVVNDRRATYVAAIVNNTAPGSSFVYKRQLSGASGCTPVRATQPDLAAPSTTAGVPSG